MKKIFILLPDGIGLRNFAFTKFQSLGLKMNFDICFWNNTPFPLQDLGFKEILIKNPQSHPLTDVLKNARKHIELNLSIAKTKDSVYDKYRFPFSYKNIKSIFKSLATQFLIFLFSSEKGLRLLQKLINRLEKKTRYYSDSLKTLQKEKPSFVFCTNQRPLLAIAPLLAAKELGIPTATFIFSWDNLPKATMVVETDYYFVWSEHMKNELRFYYPYIKESQIKVTGTPQFESHFNPSILKTKEEFFTENGLDLNKKYICYSGDDITTSPNDPKYLEDVAKAVIKINQSGQNIGILFRRCPVDFSTRFDQVLETYKDVIVSVQPKWVKKGEMWNTILPTKEDSILLVNTIKHTECVINLGSSMVFDYATFHKRCLFINYDVDVCVMKNWSVKKIYNYVHFRSMPNKNAVIWINSPHEIQSRIESILTLKEINVTDAQEWFNKIVGKNPQEASENIWNEISKIL